MTTKKLIKNEMTCLSNDELILAIANKLKAVYTLYNELYGLEDEFINRVRDKLIPKGKTHLNANYDVVAKYYANRIVDFKKLERDYPNLYAQGLVTMFSMDELLKTVSREQAFEIIRDLSVKNPKYVLRYERKKLNEDVKNRARITKK